MTNPKFIVAIHVNEKDKKLAWLFGFSSLKAAKEFGEASFREYAIAKTINPRTRAHA